MNKPTLTNTPFAMRYRPDDNDYPGYWITMIDVTSDNGEELILFTGLSEESASSIFDRINLFLEHWLKEDFGIF